MNIRSIAKPDREWSSHARMDYHNPAGFRVVALASNKRFKGHKPASRVWPDRFPSPCDFSFEIAPHFALPCLRHVLRKMRYASNLIRREDCHDESYIAVDTVGRGERCPIR